MIVESTVKGLYKVPIPDPAQPRNCQCSKVLGTIHRSPGHTTFSQVVRIGRFKFPWNPKRIKNTTKLSCTSTNATPTLLIDKIKRPLQHLQHYLPLGVVSSSKRSLIVGPLWGCLSSSSWQFRRDDQNWILGSMTHHLWNNVSIVLKIPAFFFCHWVLSTSRADSFLIS